MKIMDYPCSGEHRVFPFSQSGMNSDDMAKLAKAVCQNRGTSFCVLPFCHTLEAEAMGAQIFLGDEKSGPRVRSFSFTSLDALEEKLDFNWETPRLKDVLDACRQLQTQGERVLFQISGPLTILGSLLPPDLLYRGLRKDTERILRLMDRINMLLLQLIRKVEEQGVNLFSYADPSAAVNIVGPKYAEIIAQLVTVPFLREWDRQEDREALVFLCPKTACALVGADCADWRTIPLPEQMDYAEAALSMQKNLRFVGQSCINQTNHSINHIMELKLKKEAVFC